MSVCERKAHSLIELKILIALLVVGVTKRGKKIIVVKVTSLFHFYFGHCSPDVCSIELLLVKLPNYLITARPDLDDSWAIFWRESQIDNNETSGSVQVPCPRPLARLCPRAPAPASLPTRLVSTATSLIKMSHILCYCVPAAAWPPRLHNLCIW